MSDAPISKAPTADNKTIETNMNTPVQITLTGTAPKPEDVKFSVLGSPQNGTVTPTAVSNNNNNNNNNIFYTPKTGFIGADSFAYKATVGQGVDSDVATVTITVKAPPRNWFIRLLQRLFQREDTMSAGLWKGKPISETVTGVPDIVPFLVYWHRTANYLRTFQILLGALATLFSILTATFVGFSFPDYITKIFAFIAAAAIGLMTSFDLGTKSNNMTNAWRDLAFAVMKFNKQIGKAKDVINAWKKAEKLIGDVTYQQTGGPTPRGARSEAGDVTSIADELMKFANLKEKGIISEDEFQQMKQDLINWKYD